nr:hypothetical protein [Pantoea sp. CCBC3-3-1]
MGINLTVRIRGQLMYLLRQIRCSSTTHSLSDIPARQPWITAVAALIPCWMALPVPHDAIALL